MSQQRILLAVVAVLALAALALLLIPSGEGNGGGGAGSGALTPVPPGEAPAPPPGEAPAQPPPGAERRSSGAPAREGQVVDEAGSAVEGARVWMGAETGAGAVTGAEGRFSIPEEHRRAAGAVPVRVFADGFLPRTLSLHPLDDWRIVLERGGVLEVQVVDVRGENLLASIPLALRSGNIRREVHTDSKGFLRSSGWPYRPVEVVWEELPVGVSEPLHPEGPVRILVKLRAYQGRVVQGRVTSGGRPVPGARIHPDELDFDREPVLCDAEGRFSFQVVEVEDPILVVEADGFAPVARLLAPEDLAGREMEIRLEPGRLLTGQVLFQPGSQPAAGAEVTVQMQLPFQGLDPEPGRRGTHYFFVRGRSVDEGGLFDSGWIPSNTETSFFASLEEQQSSRETRAPGDQSEVVLHLDAPLRVSGRVTDPLGRPIADARLGTRRHLKPHRVGYRRNRWTVDEDGRYVMKVPPAKWPDGFWVVASAPGCLPEGVRVDTSRAGVDVEANVVLRPSSAGRITGRVRDADGNPVRKVRVRAKQGDQETWGTRTDPFGRFWLRSLPRGRYEIFVDKPPEGLEGGRVVVSTDTDDLVLTLAAPRFLEGRLVPPAGWEGKLDAEVMLLWDDRRGEEGFGYFWVNGPDGTFRLDPPPPDVPFRLMVVPTGLAPELLGPLRWSEEQPLEPLEVPLEEGVVMEGRAVLPEGEAPELETLQFRDCHLAWPVDDSVGENAWTLPVVIGQDGSFRIEHAPLHGTMRFQMQCRTPEGSVFQGEIRFTGAPGRELVLPLEKIR